MRDGGNWEAWLGDGRAHQGVVAARASWARPNEAVTGGCAATRRRMRHSKEFLTDFRAGAAQQLQKPGARSAFSSIGLFRDVPIRKKVIGHSVSVRRRFFAARAGLSRARDPVALLQKQASYGSVGLIGQPLVHQRADFLAQIGGIGKTRQLEALQAVLRCEQQKIPRRLDTGTSAAGYGNACPNSSTVIQESRILRYYVAVEICRKVAGDAQKYLCSSGDGPAQAGAAPGGEDAARLQRLRRGLRISRANCALSPGTGFIAGRQR
jgi:hypothetical protein